MTDFYVRCACGHVARVPFRQHTASLPRQCDDCFARESERFVLEQDALRREYLDRHPPTGGPSAASVEGER